MRSELPLFQSQLLIRPGQDMGDVEGIFCAIGNALERAEEVFLPPQERYTVVINSSGLSELAYERQPTCQKRGSILGWVATAIKITLLFPLLLVVLISKLVRRSNFAILLARATAQQQEEQAPLSKSCPDLYKGCGTIKSVLRKTLSEAAPSLEVLINPSGVWGKAALTLLLHSKTEAGKMKWGEVISGRPTIYLVTSPSSRKEIQLVTPDLLNGRHKPCDFFDEILELATELQTLEEEEIDLIRLALSGNAPIDCPLAIQQIAERVAKVGAHLKECHPSYTLQSWSANGSLWESALALALTPPDLSLFSEERASVRNFEELWQQQLTHASRECPAQYVGDQRNQAVRLLALQRLLEGAVCSLGEQRILWLTPYLPLCFSPIVEVNDPDSYPDELLCDLHPLFFQSSESNSALTHDIAYQLARRLSNAGSPEKAAGGKASYMWAQELSRQLEQRYPELKPLTKNEEDEALPKLPSFVEQCLKYPLDSSNPLKKQAYADFTPADPDHPLDFEIAATYAQAEYYLMDVPDHDHQPPGNCMLVALLTQGGIVKDPTVASLEVWTKAIDQYRTHLAAETRKQAQKLKRTPLETDHTFQMRKEMLIDRAKKIEENDWLEESELPLLSKILGRSIMIFSVALFEKTESKITQEMRGQKFFLNANNELLPSPYRIFHPPTGPTEEPITILFNETNHYHPVKKQTY